MVTTIHEERRTESLSDDKVSVKRVLRVQPYAARLDVIGSLLGGVRLVGRTLIRTPPARDPWLPWCFCKSVEVEGIGSIGGSSLADPDHLNNANVYGNGALLTASYETLDYDAEQAGDGSGESQQGNQSEQQEIDLTSQGYDFSTTSLTLPNKRMAWESTAAPATADGLLVRSDVAAAKVLPRIQYELTRHYVAYLPVEAVTKLLGRINEAEFRIGQTRWAPETVRFESLSAKRKTTSRGVKFMEVSYKFAINPIYEVCADTDPNPEYVGWNRLFRPDTGMWQYALWAAEPTKKIYEPDTDITQTLRGRVVSGFNLLWNPRAK